MTFTDDDIKRLKERLGAMRPLHEMKPHMTPIELDALLARLEAAEALIGVNVTTQPVIFENRLKVWRKAAGKDGMK